MALFVELLTDKGHMTINLDQIKSIVFWPKEPRGSGWRESRSRRRQRRRSAAAGAWSLLSLRPPA